MGKHQIAGDIGCHLFASLPPFEIGGSTMGYGLGPASNAAFDGGGEKRSDLDPRRWRLLAQRAVVLDRQRRLQQVRRRHVIVDNYYSAATGGQDILSSRADNATKATGTRSPKAVKGVGVGWVRQIDRTYDVPKMREIAERGADHRSRGPEGHRRLVGMHAEQAAPRKAADEQGDQGRPPGREAAFGVDEDICTGDHACMRLSGCPSLTLKKLDDPLRDDPVA
jgi:indolepyruvate ferredoxin oxidoreductase alpha subunit